MNWAEYKNHDECVALLQAAAVESKRTGVSPEVKAIALEYNAPLKVLPTKLT